MRLVADSAAGERVLVDGISFTIPRGGALGLVGASGSGKSLTAAALIGLLPGGVRRVAGSLRWREGADLATLPEAELRRYRGARIGFVFQDPLAALNPVLSIGRQLDEVLRLHRPALDAAARRAEGERAFAAVELPEPATIGRRFPHELSGGQRQRALIAIALAGDPELLIADEPTTALDASIQSQVVELLDRLRRERALALLWISHDLALLRSRVEEFVILHHGRVVERGAPAQIFARPQHAHTRELVAAATASATARVEPPRPAPVLKLSGLRVFHAQGRRWTGAPASWRESVRGVDLELRAGETLALVGESGSGKSTLVRALLRLPGARVEGRAELRLGGAAPVDWLALPEAAARPLRRHFGLVFQDPTSSLDPRMRVGQSIAEPLEVHDIVRGAALQARVLTLLAQVGLEPEHAERRPGQLSGGQNQRVAIARALATEPAVLICDEAVSALDLAVQRRILELLRGLQDRLGFALLFVTHDLAVVRELAHRAAVMEEGRIVEEGPAHRLLDAPVSAAARAMVAAARALHSEPR